MVLLEKKVSTGLQGRLLAVLAFRGPGNLGAFKLLDSRKRAPNYSLRSHIPFKCHVLGTINALPLGAEMSVGSGEHQHEG